MWFHLELRNRSLYTGPIELLYLDDSLNQIVQLFFVFRFFPLRRILQVLVASRFPLVRGESTAWLSLFVVVGFFLEKIFRSSQTH
jgi:hypothetical protein